MSRQTTRRAFLKASAAAAGVLILPDSRSARCYAANDKPHLAHVGCGGRGALLFDRFAGQTTVVALCDVNDAKAAKRYRQFPKAPKFKDFRVMLDKAGKDIDAVVVATPDHAHAVISAAAIRAGKHVYTEKPLTRTVGESRVLRALASKHKVATSMGNQGTGAGPYRRALELIQAGKIGRVKEVHVWCEGPGPRRLEPPTETQKVPPYLSWDLWLGPARFRPFHIRWTGWHHWRDFGTGNLGNWASHSANLAFRALKVDTLWTADPKNKPIVKVQATPAAVSTVAFPHYERARWEIPARGDLPPIAFTWCRGHDPEGRKRIEDVLGRKLDWGDAGAKRWADFAGCLLVGTEGTIYSTGHNATFTFLEADKFKDVQRSRPETVDASRGHFTDWLIACKGGKPAWASFDYASKLNEFLQIANIATQMPDKTLEYDPRAGRIVNHPAADALISPPYRKGWSL